MIEPVFPLTISIVVAVVVLAILVFLETRRKLKFLVLRIIAQVLMVSAVLLLTLRPSIKTNSKESLLLLTNGYDRRVVDSLSSLKPVEIKSPNELAGLAGVSVIAGNGLPSWAIDLLPAKNYSFVPSSSPKGITSIEFDPHIYAHRWNEIHGTYHGDSTFIKLRGPGGIEDSVQVSNGSFTLSFFAKAPGRFNYHLIADGEQESLPIVIEPEKTFNIIFISNYPTFEMRYLKNFLASKGHHLSIRNQVSRGRYKFEFANRPASNFQSLSAALLNGTDLLIIDERSWNSLGNAEQKTVRAEISDGLGVVILPETGKQQLLSFRSTEEKDTARISTGKAGAIRLPALSLEAAGSTPLLRSGERVVNGYTYSGAGKIGYQLLSETYQAGLEGKGELYAALWVPLLERSARTSKDDLKLRITSPFPYYENEPISFDVISSGKEPRLAIDGIDFPLTEDVYIDDLWHGTTWLDGNKWHEFTMDSVMKAVHVAKAGTWKSVSATNNRNATALQAGQQSGVDNNSTSTDDTAIKISLFAVFVLSAGFLWLAPKL